MKAHAKMLEHVQSSKQMKTDTEMVGKAHSGLNAMWPNLYRNAVEKNGNQTPIAHLDQNSPAPLKLESYISREITMDDGICSAGVHIGINPSPRFVETQ